MRHVSVVAGLAIAFMAVGAADVMAKPKSTLQISLRTALSFNDPPGCNHTPARPCGDHGTFTAKNRAAAVVLCAKGTMAESYYFAATGQPAASSIVKRTLTCSDGSTLVMNVRRVVFTKLTATPLESTRYGT